MKLEQVLKDSNYSLSLFTLEEIEALENRIEPREVREKRRISRAVWRVNGKFR